MKEKMKPQEWNAWAVAVAINYNAAKLHTDKFDFFHEWWMSLWNSPDLRF